jgi:quinoprotein glucose dehydrogenase
MRTAARELMAVQDPQAAIPLLAAAARNGERIERQGALNALRGIRSSEADRVLADILQELVGGNYPAYAHLEVLAAAAGREESRVRSLLEQYEATRDPALPVTQYRESLVGGDAERGRQIFFERTQVSCLRCHKIGGDGGEVGPDLTRIAAEKNREYLLEAIVDPNRTIAKGFESVMLADDEGRIHLGILKEENAQTITLMTADGRTMTIAQQSIEARRAGQSAMPADLVQHLTKGDVRDLVEFLAQLDGQGRAASNAAP